MQCQLRQALRCRIARKNRCRMFPKPPETRLRVFLTWCAHGCSRRLKPPRHRWMRSRTLTTLAMTSSMACRSRIPGRWTVPVTQYRISKPCWQTNCRATWIWKLTTCRPIPTRQTLPKPMRRRWTRRLPKNWRSAWMKRRHLWLPQAGHPRNQRRRIAIPLRRKWNVCSVI